MKLNEYAVWSVECAMGIHVDRHHLLNIHEYVE